MLSSEILKAVFTSQVICTVGSCEYVNQTRVVRRRGVPGLRAALKTRSPNQCNDSKVACCLQSYLISLPNSVAAAVCSSPVQRPDALALTRRCTGDDIGSV